MKALEASIKTHIDAGERVVLRGLGSFTRGEGAGLAGFIARAATVAPLFRL